MAESNAPSTPETTAEDRVCLGVVAGAHGVRGLLKIKSFTAEPLDIGAYGPLSDAKGQRRFDPEIKGRVKESVLVAFAGVTDRDQAQALRGTRLYVSRSVLPEPEDEDEFYNTDLIGLRVEDGAGKVLGSVKAMHNFGGGDLLEVQPAEGKSWLVPFTKLAVPVVDLDQGRVVVERPDEVETGESGSG